MRRILRVFSPLCRIRISGRPAWHQRISQAVRIPYRIFHRYIHKSAFPFPPSMMLTEPSRIGRLTFGGIIILQKSRERIPAFQNKSCFRLFLGNRFHRASRNTCAAIDTGVRINFCFAVSHLDSLNRACSRAAFAGNTFFRINFSSHFTSSP